MLSAVIVNYNSGENLLKCVEEILDGVNEIIIVDNASSDKSVEKVSELYPLLKIIKNERNEGFSKGANRGILEARNDFILIMNPDVFINKTSIHQLLKCLLHEPSIGMVAPKLLSDNGKIELSYGNDPSLLNEFIQKIKSRLRVSGNKEKNVDWVSGACFIARKRALLDAGLFDENFFLYFEDADLSRRMRKRGWIVKYIPSASAIHIRGGSGNFERVLYEYRKSQILYYKKHNSKISLILLKAYLVLKFGFLFLMKREPVFKKIVKMVLKEI